MVAGVGYSLVKEVVGKPARRVADTVVSCDIEAVRRDWTALAHKGLMPQEISQWRVFDGQELADSDELSITSRVQGLLAPPHLVAARLPLHSSVDVPFSEASS